MPTYYVSPFRQLRENSNPSATQKLSNGVLFHQNNAPLQKSVIAMATINANGFDLIANPPYLPAFASPSGFHLFPTLEKVIVGTRFWSDDDVIHTVRSSQGFKGDIAFFTAGKSYRFCTSNNAIICQKANHT